MQGWPSGWNWPSPVPAGHAAAGPPAGISSRHTRRPAAVSAANAGAAAAPEAGRNTIAASPAVAEHSAGCLCRERGQTALGSCARRAHKAGVACDRCYPCPNPTPPQ